jgi:pimeloyl-ACP methyl ester carboxylesterase
MLVPVRPTLVSALVLTLAVAACAPPAAQLPDHRSRMLDLGSRMTEIVEWGDVGPAIVLIHGANGSPHYFDRFAARFSDRYHLVAYARRGHGKATPPSEPFDVDDLAEDMRVVMDSLGIERAVLMGHSFGGNEITRFAALHPERVAGLVYLDAHYLRLDGVEKEEVEPFYPECATTMASRADLNACLETYLLSPFPWDETMDEMVADMLVDTAGPPVYKIAAEHVMPSMTEVSDGYRREYERLLAPALFVMSETTFSMRTPDEDWNRRYAAWIDSAGERDQQESLVRELREAFPEARVVTIAGGTHDFITEFQETIDEVERFLAGAGS